MILLRKGRKDQHVVKVRPAEPGRCSASLDHDQYSGEPIGDAARPTTKP